MTNEQAHQLVAMLEHAQRRPGMFFPVDRSGVKGFLAGIYVMQLTFFGPPEPSSIGEDVYRERGWTPNVPGFWADMERRQYTMEAMIQEVLSIEIEILRRTFHLDQTEG